MKHIEISLLGGKIAHGGEKPRGRWEARECRSTTGPCGEAARSAIATRVCFYGARNEKPHGWAVAVTRKHGAAACGFYSEGAEVGPNHGGSRNAD